MLGIGVSISIGTPAVTEPAEAVALYGRMSTPPSGTTRRAISDFISNLKADGIWGKIDMLQVYSTAVSATQTDLLLNWKGNYANGTAVNSPVFGASGVTGNGTTSYVNTGFDPQASSLFLQNDNHLGLFVSANGIQLITVDIGNTDNSIGVRNTSNTIGVRSSTTTVGATVATVTDGTGYHLATRNNGANVALYKGGTLFETITLASTAQASANIYVGARNNAGVAVNQSPRTYFAAHAGASLTALEAANLNARLNTLATALGA